MLNNIGFFTPHSTQALELPTTNLVLRLDGKQEDSITYAASPDIDKWADISSYGREVKALYSYAAPTRVTDGVSFSGSSQAFTNSVVGTERDNITAATWVCVYERAAFGGNQIIYEVSYPNVSTVLSVFKLNSGGGIRCVLRNSTGNSQSVQSTTENLNQKYLVVAIWDRPNLKLYIDGALIGEITTADMVPTTLDLESIGSSGNGSWFNGILYSLLQYNEAVDDTKRLEIEAYLTDRFGL